MIGRSGSHWQSLHTMIRNIQQRSVHRSLQITEGIQTRGQTYSLNLPKTWKGIYPVINEGHLLPYQAPVSPLQKQPPPPPAVVVDGEEEYKVAVIHGKKWSRNQDLYLVKWVGYPNKVDWTWEPRKNLVNAKEILQAFEKWSNSESLWTTTLG